MRTERGFHRLVAFSDAVVAIAITLLVLPLVDKAGDIGSMGIDQFLDANRARLLAFVLSFVVIGNYWWSQHRLFERLRTYNGVLAVAMYLWLFSIVFLPFPTELVGSAQHAGRVVHGIYIGTLLVATIAAAAQQWAAVRWTDLQEESRRGSLRAEPALVAAFLMMVAFAVAIVCPSVGLWSLLVLVPSTYLEHIVAKRASAITRWTTNVGRSTGAGEE